MKVTWSWLAEWVDLPATPLELAGSLAMRGLPVQSIERGGAFDPGIVVGAVLEVAPHPDADRLRVCTVDVGAARLRVVCGASNVAPGQRVAVAQVGSRLPDSTRIRKSRIRGVESEGMICSERELGLSEESEGIWVLPGSPALGAPLASVLGGDPVVDIEVTPNRNDCLSVRGLAREVASLRGTPLHPPRTLLASAAGTLPEVSIQAPADCPRYMARLVRGLRIGPPPAWLKRRIEAGGFRSINNVVDATNYVLATHGQPIHAFDAARVRENRIEVRRARPGETLTLLDGREVSLDPRILLIADAVGPMALAGIMGGLESGVTEKTTSVVLESAQFDPALTRAATQTLGFETDASQRFAQGVDPDGVALALDDVARLLGEVAQGEILAAVVDRWPGKGPRARVSLRMDRARGSLGIPVEASSASRALESLGIRQATSWSGGAGQETASFEIPGYRRDLVLEVDLIEEVARVVGYDSIPSSFGSVSLPGRTSGSRNDLITRVITIACGLGFDEVLNTVLVGALPDAWGSTAGGALWEVRNPKSRELRHVRPAILPGLLGAAARNLRHGAGEVRLVECGKVFSAVPGPLGSERLELGLVLGGVPDAWSRPAADPNRFLELKGAVESLLGALGIDSPRGRSYHEPCWSPGSGVRLESGGGALAALGEIAPEVGARWGVDQRLWAAVLDLAAVERAMPARRSYRPIHRFPTSKRDLALIVGREVRHGDLQAAIEIGGGVLLAEARLFDLFEGPQVGPGRKSVAFALQFRAPDRTLSDPEVDEIVTRIAADLTSRFGATWRRGAGVPAETGPSIA